MNVPEGNTNENSDGRRSGTRSVLTRRGGRILGVVAILLILFLAGMPSIVGNTRVLNALLKSGLSKNEIEGRIGSARLGWFTSARLRNIRFTDQQQRWMITADEASTELTLWQLIWSGGQLGEFRIQGPTVLIDASRPWPPMSPEEPSEEKASAEIGADGSLRICIENGNVLVRTEDDFPPASFLKNLNVTVDYQQQQDDRVLIVEPGRPIEEANLTKEMCNLGIKYVVPILADVTWVRGSLSLQLEQCRIPLHRPQDARVKGHLEIRAVDSGLQESLAGQMAQIVSQLGVEEFPDTVKLAQDSIVKFEVENGRVTHQDLAFGLPGLSPNLVITTEGSVGMDSTLDLIATLPPVGEWMGEGLLGQVMRTNRLSLPVTGTLDNPKVSLAGHQQIVGSLLEQVAPGLTGEEPISPETIDETLNQVGETVVDVLEVLRQRREQRREERAAQESAEPQTESDIEDEGSELLPGILDRIRERRERRRPGRGTP
ncbi:MAG: AsmA-like C-terminal region-containing protein [Planctomycetaceae bacterium]|nr:AsmA-like C-terminal region-containing protein [Planctomycetaceae bacterium]